MARTQDVALSLLLVLGVVAADVYFHAPRGSNNRLNGKGRNRSNGNRLFDSQNNDRGGYNVGDDGSMYYLAGSTLRMEWTNQHGCNNENVNCNFVIQYMCGDDVRDGTSERTINSRKGDDPKYGMHENKDYHVLCMARSNNKGLFLGDETLKRRAAQYTRQNANGKRRGFECPEERDYYPYWAPSPWVDIAVLTDDVSRCPEYQRESQNVKAKFHCMVKPEYVGKVRGTSIGFLPIDQTECEAVRKMVKGQRGTHLVAEWRAEDAHGVDAPDCQMTQHSRDNHLGNTRGGQHMSYNWTVPDLDQDNCVLRIRYNISTNDYDGDATFADTEVDVGSKYGLDAAEAEARGYVFGDNPDVKIFPDLDLELSIALNTNQYGRTFQDRSHVFSIRPRSTAIPPTAAIHNLNVRGKRGNIVQTYPAMEYDFVPNRLEVVQGDYVHIQWNGADTNPKNNAGQGEAGTDRSNICVMDEQRFPEGSGAQWGPGAKYGHYGLNFPETLNNATFLGLNTAQLEQLAFLDPANTEGGTLDDTEAYFDLGPQEVTSPAGIYYYFSTRNNAFTNRDQKANVVVYTQAQATSLARKKKQVDDLTLTESSLLSLLENSI